MLISAEEIRNRLARQKLRIALIGMSNSGKSTCTGLLARELDFAFFEVDEAINRELGTQSMSEAAQWMGYPFDPKYETNKKRYLELEAHFSRVEIPQEKNFVLDTTGSIIYADSEILNWIRDNFLVIGLRVSDELCQTLIDDYFEHPKTVIWGDEFKPEPDESGIDALKRCYPNLLQNRAAFYSQLADVEIPADATRESDLSAERFFDLVETALEQA